MFYILHGQLEIGLSVYPLSSCDCVLSLQLIKFSLTPINLVIVSSSGNKSSRHLYCILVNNTGQIQLDHIVIAF